MKIKRAFTSVIAGFSIAVGCLAINNLSANAATTQNGVTNDQINQYVNNATLEQKVGQMYVSRTPQDPNQVKNDVSKYNLGGLIVYDADMKGLTQQQFKDKMKSFQDSAQTPLLVGVDQEGGLVSRLTHSGLVQQNGNQFAFPRKQYEEGGMKEVVDDAEKNATLLQSLGINWNYAPDADYSTKPGTFMWDRTFGQGYQQTADYLSKVVPAWQHDNLVASTLKHFPGYGDAADTHTGFAENSKSLTELENQDMVPFKAGMKAGADSVMVTHVIYNKIDPEYPASLSPKINSLIRNNCNYNGVIVTDALEMGAITDFAKEHGNASVDVLAVKAGNDMIMTTDYATGIKEIVSAVKAGEIPESQINASVTRILQLKNKLGLLKPENLMFRKPTNNNNNNTSTIINPGNTDHKNPSVISGNNSITISGITYNNDKKVAFINGKVSDPAAEGSMIMTATSANTGKKITTAVVGGKGVFAIELPMTNEVQNVKITSDDDSYAAVTTKVEAIKADKPVVNTDQNNKQNSSTEKQTNKQNNSVKDEVNITLNTEKQANSAKKNTQVVSKNINSEKTTVTNPVYKSAIKTNYQGKNVITTSHDSAAHAVAQKSNNNAKVLPKTGTKENIVALFGLAITSTTALFGLALRKKN